ncbi:MAG: undecaprenyldiphospho-muramoylpentapeptide beta-N-acetylglucosaminyltransferase [Patescibacteria group bacterium]|nr:undecaprenyldiphospho-muramoylpentapeptide beta-N-acetylglucosaminyltransferase [Patescibacteria group bacterium]
MKIVFAGGGTMGSVSPLLAIRSALSQQGVKVEGLWLGTAEGPERAAVERQGIAFQALKAGKLRRYFDWRTLTLPFTLSRSALKARKILQRFSPDVVVTAGSYVAVPVVVAAWSLRIPSLLHQQDVVPSLTNRLLAPFSSAITVTFTQSLKHFPKRKTLITGNPVRPDLKLAERSSAYAQYRFSDQVPTILVLGGGTGAAALNRLVWDGLDRLVSFCQVIHLTGRGKMAVIPEHSRYRAFEFVDTDMAYAYAVADLAVTRAGMGALSELAALGKPAIVIPIPNSHQEANALAFAKNNAAILLPQHGLAVTDFVEQIRKTLEDRALLNNLSRNIGQLLPENAVRALTDVVRRFAAPRSADKKNPPQSGG